MARTDDRYHAQLERDVIEEFEKYGMRTASLTYHENMPEQLMGILRRNESIAAHVVRTRADRHAFNDQRVVKWDAKTSTWKHGQDFAIEAVPLLCACVEAELFGCEYLFCCRRHDGHEYGLLAGKHAIGRVQRFLVPEWRHSNSYESWRDWIRHILTVLDAKARVMQGDCSQGSGDAFAALHVDDLPPWQDAIAYLC